VLDGFGHISVRNPQRADRFFIARAMAPALVTPEDIVELDLDCKVYDEQNRRTYLECAIHSEIYRVRPDVQSVVHSHSPTVIPFGVTGNRLRPICHMSGFLGGSTPIFEIRDVEGLRTDLLVSNQKRGKALAQTLGNATVALLRGHGNVVVGHSIKQSVYRAIYTENNARLQLQAQTLGQVTFLSAEESEETTAMQDLDSHLQRPWELWVKRASE
jgi:HCOMODA/2-hydroxy-3-carboxy-muconic semialdehyde decarboxylase